MSWLMRQFQRTRKEHQNKTVYIFVFNFTVVSNIVWGACSLAPKNKDQFTTACSIKCLHEMFQHTSCVYLLRASLDHVRENENDHSSSQSSLNTKVWFALRARVHGPWPLPRLARCSHQAKICLGGVPAQARATENEVELRLPRGWWYVTLLLKNFAGAPCCWLCFMGEPRCVSEST